MTVKCPFFTSSLTCNRNWADSSVAGFFCDPVRLCILAIVHGVVKFHACACFPQNPKTSALLSALWLCPISKYEEIWSEKESYNELKEKNRDLDRVDDGTPSLQSSPWSRLCRTILGWLLHKFSAAGVDNFRCRLLCSSRSQRWRVLKFTLLTCFSWV